MRTFILLLWCVFYSQAGIYDHRDIKEITLNSFNIKIQTVQNKKDIMVFINNEKISKYTEDGGIPEIKEILFCKKNQYLGILVGWDSYHSAINTKGDMYLLEVFYNNNDKFKKLNYLSKEGFEGILDGNQTYFKYKNKNKILEYISSLNTKAQIQVQKQYLFNKPNKNSKTKMYLIKGDKVEILEEKDDWLYILYRGKKDIKAWIPKSAVEDK